MTERLNLMVPDGIGDTMTVLAGGERRRGQWLGDLVRAIDEQEQQGLGSDLEALRLAFAGLAGQHKALESRLIKVEQQLAHAAAVVNGLAEQHKAQEAKLIRIEQQLAHAAAIR